MPPPIEEKEDQYTPYEDAIEEIYMADDYGITYITFSVLATIIIILVLISH